MTLEIILVFHILVFTSILELARLANSGLVCSASPASLFDSAR